jgi:hypothetical protein
MIRGAEIESYWEIPQQKINRNTKKLMGWPCLERMRYRSQEYETGEKELRMGKNGKAY